MFCVGSKTCHKEVNKIIDIFYSSKILFWRQSPEWPFFNTKDHLVLFHKYIRAYNYSKKCCSNLKPVSADLRCLESNDTQRFWTCFISFKTSSNENSAHKQRHVGGISNWILINAIFFVYRFKYIFRLFAVINLKSLSLGALSRV